MKSIGTTTPATIAARFEAGFGTMVIAPEGVAILEVLEVGEDVVAPEGRVVLVEG